MKSLNRRIIPLCLLVASVSLLQAQFLERQLLSPYGKLSTTNDVHVSATGGELMVTTVSTASVTATQGFQQPNIEDIVGTFEWSELDMDVQVFPNPVGSYLNVSFKTEASANVLMELYDISGKLVYYSPLIDLPEQNLEIIEFAEFPNGQYYLLVRDDEKKLMKTFKVQKH